MGNRLSVNPEPIELTRTELAALSELEVLAETAAAAPWNGAQQ